MFFYLNDNDFFSFFPKQVPLISKALRNSRNYKILKLESSLFFANCEDFVERINNLPGLEASNESVEKNSQYGQYTAQKATDLILDFSSVNYIDTNGIKALEQSILDLKQKNIFVYICKAQGNKKFEIFKNFF